MGGVAHYGGGMVVHPLPPADVPSFIEAYREVLGTFVGTCDGLREAEWELPTSCPGWTVKDHVAHVVHVESVLAGLAHPAEGHTDDLEIRVGSPEHVRHSFGAWMEEGVRAREDLTGPELVQALREVAEIRLAALYDPDLEMDTPVPSVRGRQDPFGEVIALRVADIWVHGQDIRAVVDRPGALDSPGAAVFTSYVLSTVPDIVLGLEPVPAPGTVVILESTGPVTGRAGVRIGTDAEGAPCAHELFTGHTSAEDDSPDVDESPDAVTTIMLSTHELTRRAAGRQTAEETAYQVQGDEDLASRVLDALDVTP